MTASPSKGLGGPRFVNLCVAHWFLQIYVASLIPLLHAQLLAWGAPRSVLGWSVLAFGAGMVLPGPFGACLMERQSRKAVCLKAVCIFGPVATAGYLFAQGSAWVIALQAVQGAAFGLAQTALGSTLVNDVLHSRHRNRGDLLFAWAGRFGLPLGLCLGCVLAYVFPLRHAYLWALVPCMAGLLYIVQTAIPVKAPVRVPLLTLDRFFLPRSFPLCLSLFAAPWTLGRVTGGLPEGYAYLCMGAGVLAAFLMQLALRHRVGQWLPVFAGYLLVGGSLALLQSAHIHVLFAAYALLGMGVAAVSSRHLMDWVETAEHCQRGTAQSTYRITWRLAFCGGFAAGCCCVAGDFLFEGVLCALSLLFYLLLSSPRCGLRSVSVG